MIRRETDDEWQNALYYDLVLDDIVLSDFDGTTEQLQHLLDVNCAPALSVCKSRNLPSCVFVLSLLYMKRLRELRSSSSLVCIENLTTKELYLIATLLADKYLVDEGEDEQVFNSEWAEVAGVSTERINLIERQVLVALNWNLHVPTDEFKQFFSAFKLLTMKSAINSKETSTNDDSVKFYAAFFALLPHMIEYLALTSLFIVGSAISLTTAIRTGTVAQSILMRTLNPTTSSSSPSVCHWNNDTVLQEDRFDLPAIEVDLEKNIWLSQPSSFINETTDVRDLDPLPRISICTSHRRNSFSYSLDITRRPLISRSLIESFG